MKEIKLNEQQRLAVSHVQGPMMVLSVAGSGKTHVLTERIVALIQNQNVHPSSLLAITFAKKAANEMMGRLERRLNGTSRKLTVCTFHSFGYRILKETSYPGPQFRVIQNGIQMDVLLQAIRKVGVLDEPVSLLNRVSAFKNALITPKDLASSDDETLWNLAKIYQEYELIKRRKHLVDYDDLLCLPYRLLSQNEELLERYRQRFRFVLVDEFQDSSKVMVELVKILADGHRNIWACGDDDQVIHAFRGADPEVFGAFEKHFREGLQTIHMSQNYRSSKNIIKAANRLISHNKTRIQKKMKAESKDGEPIRVLDALNENAEAELIVEEVKRLKEKRVPYAQMAILARVHRLLPLIEGAFLRNGIPYNSRHGHMFQRPEIKTVMAVMKFLETGEAGRGLDVERINLIKADLFPGEDTLSQLDVFDLASTYVLSGFQNGLDGDGVNLVQAYLDAFQWLLFDQKDPKELASKKSSAGGGVQLMTIHQSKGLEFDALIIPGVNEGLLPHINSLEQNAGLEEERRLMYVAVTRARKHLVITHRKRQDGKSVLPSRFIKEMEIDLQTAS